MQQICTGSNPKNWAWQQKSQKHVWVFHHVDPQKLYHLESRWPLEKVMGEDRLSFSGPPGINLLLNFRGVLGGSSQDSDTW